MLHVEGDRLRPAWLHAAVGAHSRDDFLAVQFDDGVEFVTIILFDSLDAVRAFAGEDYEVAVVPPTARRLLSKFDNRSAHYEVIQEPV